SATTSAANPSACTSTTVRQTPFTAIDAPSAASSTTTAASTTSRDAASPRVWARTRPTSSTIPVNIRYLRPSDATGSARENGYQATTEQDAKTSGSADHHDPSSIRTLTVGPGLAPD